jgi:hypothetical protein
MNLFKARLCAAAGIDVSEKIVIVLYAYIYTQENDENYIEDGF